ncbi:MAG: type II toxin-antitoxin system Phd/YefM family antitoxin [Thermoleophilia bacterium]|nr:type II toxin-antitoxin system Phd/YefM family antitoxin [Thermoleophilia bacterium]
MSISQARTHFARILAEAGRGRRILLDRHGKGIAAIVPVEDLRLLCELEDFYDARAARADAQAHGTVPWDELKAELGG